MAPAARAIGNAVACWGPSKIGSVSAVRNGVVFGVEMTCSRVDLAAVDEAAVTTASTQRAETAHQRNTMRIDAWRDVAFQRETETRNRT